MQARIAAHIAARRKKAAADFKPFPIERPAPAFGATLLDGSKVSLASLRGRPVVLNFWAVGAVPAWRNCQVCWSSSGETHRSRSLR